MLVSSWRFVSILGEMFWEDVSRLNEEALVAWFFFTGNDNWNIFLVTGQMS